MPATSDNATIADLRQRIAELEHDLAAARTDPLTGLATRQHWMRLAAAYYPDARAALLVDVNRFKAINDTHGHDVGDQVLAELADRLRTGLGTDALLARLGGDEFAGLVRITPQPHHLDRLIDLLGEPIALGKRELPLGVSLGVALVGTLPDATLREALHAADMAMYHAKRRSGGWQIYDPRAHGLIELTAAPRHRVRHHGTAA